jgi:hypothetical protein
MDVTGKKVIVIGSGATAATVIPAIAGKAAHVTMLQRSPTYFFCSPNQNELADRLREIGVDEPTVHRVVRQQIMYDQQMLTQRCIDEPEVVVEELKELIRLFCAGWRYFPGGRSGRRQRGDRPYRPLYRKGNFAEIRRGAGSRCHHGSHWL